MQQAKEGRESKIIDKTVARFFKDIASSETAYAKSLQKLGSSQSFEFSPTTKGSTLEGAWTTFRTGFLNMLSQQHQSNANIDSKTTETLLAFRQQKFEERKSFSERGQALLQKTHEINQAQNTARNSYERACELAESQIGRGHRAADSAKADIKTRRAIEEVDITYFEYQDACNARRKGQENFKTEMSAVLSDFQNVQAQRCMEWRRLLLARAVEQRKTLETIGMLISGTMKAQKKVSVEYDSTLFVKQYPSPTSGKPELEICPAVDLIPDIVRKELALDRPHQGSTSHGTLHATIPPGIQQSIRGIFGRMSVSFLSTSTQNAESERCRQLSQWCHKGVLQNQSQWLVGTSFCPL